MLLFFSQNNIDNYFVTGYEIERFNYKTQSLEKIILTESMPNQNDNIVNVIKKKISNVNKIEELENFVNDVRENLNYRSTIIIGTGPDADENVVFK